MTAAVDPGLLVQRRTAVARHPTQQGIERVEVTMVGATRLTLTVFFVPGEGPVVATKPRRPAVAAAQVRIWADDGGQGIPQRELSLVDVAAPAAAPDTVVLTLAATGARGVVAYLLELVDVDGLDPFFAAAAFATGAVRLRSPAQPADPVPAAPGPVPDYLARDFASVRRLMLERLATLMPGWRDNQPADAVHTVVEVLAYAADHLSYFQDAVATEAYLGTARRRISVRRHARLLDYVLHEGCNARVWVQVTVEGGPVRLPVGTRVLTKVAGHDEPLLDDAAVGRAVTAGAVVFETTADALVHPGLEALPLYDWGLTGYTLAPGATSAAVRGGHPALAAGQVLVLRAADDPAGYPVRLTDVRPSTDPLGDDGRGVAITRLTWHRADALPERLPVPPGAFALGNMVLADHGHTGPPEPLPTAGGASRVPLARAGLTWREEPPDHPESLPASTILRQDPVRAGAALTVTDTARSWVPRPDLLASDRLAAHVVVEMEDDGTAQLRFGDGECGRAVDAALPLCASYRVGNGVAGNVGRGALAHLAVSRRPAAAAGTTVELSRVTGVTNPIPAAGGTDPEPVEHARLAAPHAFGKQQRCVVEEDFVAIAEAHPEVRRASAAFRWTGTWHTAVVVVDRRGGLPVDATFRDELLARFEPYRLAGGDIDVRGPRTVPVDIVVEIAVAKGHRTDLVERGLFSAFTTAAFADRSIGEPLYLSEVIAQAAAVPGVVWADVVRFQRRGQRSQGEIDVGVLRVGPQEILRVPPGDIAFTMIREVQ